jgi:hypothetical protein
LIFISYSSSDQKVAETICDALQSRGLACWISCRDVGPGENFQESIVGAIRSAKLMLLVFTSNANNSNEIKKEIVLAGRYHLTVVPVRVEDVMPNDALAYEFATRQWIDLFKDWERGIERLVSQVGGILADGAAGGERRAPIAQQPVPRAPVVKKAALRWSLLLLLPVIAIAAGGAYGIWRPAASPPAPASALQEPSADDSAWLNAANLGTVQALKQYMDASPNGTHVAEAQQRIRTIDDKAWADAFSVGTIVALNRYVAQFPDGAHVAQARRSIAGLERQSADQDHASDRTQFDGTWLATISCSDAAGAQGYTRQLTSRVKGGVFHGEGGTQNRPNWLAVDGTIQLDGSAELFVQGIISDPAFTVGNVAAGSRYSYHVLARFEGTNGSGTRVELRPCTFTALKQ